MSGSPDDEVGYGKPPKHTRLKPGQSGNPKERRKSSKNFNFDLDEVLRAKVQIRESGKPKKAASQQAALRRLTGKAVKGDARALEKLLVLAQERSDEAEARIAERHLSVADEANLQRSEAQLIEQAKEHGLLSNVGGNCDDE